MDNQPNLALKNNDEIILASYAEKAYLEYAMSVIKGRAIPNLSDGQKPVQRRILFAMHEMGLTHQAKPSKSARVVGNVIGQFHPHGDSSAYEAMVRMAQDFTLRYPLVDGIGNYGSRDGDSAAAMRYTETRLTAIAELLLAEINMGTVDFIPNYDGVNLEPLELPARLPMLLLNGASGIAVGLATEIPSHNLTEIANACVALIKNPNMTHTDLMNYVTGPDFANGGQIINSSEEILQIYASGKGSVRVRAKFQVENLARGQWRVIVNEIPQNTSAQKILAQIEEKSNPKAKNNKKQLSQEQLNNKSLILSVLDKVRDESDNLEPIRLVFEPKSGRQNPEEFMNILMAQTDLEMNVSINLVMIDLEGKPQQKSLKNILLDWIYFRNECVIRRLQHRLVQVDKRIHILSGRMSIFIHIDEVIAIIRQSEQPKAELMQQFNLSDIQAEDILEIKLRQLAKLEWLKLEAELNKLNEEATALNFLISNDAARKKLIIKEIQSDCAKFGDARRTLIAEAKRSLAVHSTADEAITLILSKQGWIRSRVGHHLDLSLTTFKEGDALLQILETRTIAPVILFDSCGKAFTINPANIPTGRSNGIPVASLIEVNSNTNFIQMTTGASTQKILLASSDGYGFYTDLSQIMTKLKSGKTVINITNNNYLLAPIFISDEELESANIIAATSEPRLIAFPLHEMRFLNKGRGLQMMSIPIGYQLQQLTVSQSQQYQLSVKIKNKNSVETFQVADILTTRGKKGKIFKTTGNITEIIADKMTK